MNALSQKISLLLKQKNLTISEFEKNSGLGKSAVSNIIHGRSKNPSIEIITTIAKNLSCTIEYLISEPTIGDLTPSSTDINYRLCAEASSRLAEHLMSNNINLSYLDFFKCAQEIYKFSRESGQEFIDERFVKWSVKKHLEKVDNIET
jgi:transcriptional regulator with XRE-family HTH domain